MPALEVRKETDSKAPAHLPVKSVPVDRNEQNIRPQHVGPAGLQTRESK